MLSLDLQGKSYELRILQLTIDRPGNWKLSGQLVNTEVIVMEPITLQLLRSSKYCSPAISLFLSPSLSLYLLISLHPYFGCSFPRSEFTQNAVQRNEFLCAFLSCLVLHTATICFQCRDWSISP